MVLNRLPEQFIARVGEVLKKIRTRWIELRSTRRMMLLFMIASATLQWPTMSAEPTPVHFKEGSIHGFLVLRTQEGKVIAEGDLIQVSEGERLTSELTFRFRDGSIDSDTAVFSQRGTFRLIRDRHIQRGPSFPEPMDLEIEAPEGKVIVHTRNKNEEKVETNSMTIPPDLANGIILNVLKNISPETAETKLPYLIATPKPRMVTLAISPQGEETFTLAGVRQKAMRFRVKVELGGLVGLIAPMIGKQPADTTVWIAEGKVPAFVRSVGPSFLGAPIWSIEMSSPDWSHSQPAVR